MVVGSYRVVRVVFWMELGSWGREVVGVWLLGSGVGG